MLFIGAGPDLLAPSAENEKSVSDVRGILPINCASPYYREGETSSAQVVCLVSGWRSWYDDGATCHDLFRATDFSGYGLRIRLSSFSASLRLGNTASLASRGSRIFRAKSF